jgi:hypothetical protein
MDGVAQKQFNLQNMTECLLGEQLLRFIDSNAVQSGVFMAQIRGKLLPTHTTLWPPPLPRYQ